MQELPEKLPKRVRKSYRDFEKGWEDDVKSPEDAETIYQVFQQILKEHGLDLTKDLRVLEIGSGNAIFLDYLRQKGVNATGVDVKPRRKPADPELSDESDEITIPPQVSARIEQLPFKGGSFDVVLSNAVFDNRAYSQYQYFMSQEIARVLKYKGIYLGCESQKYLPQIEGFNLIPTHPGVMAYKKS